MSTPKFKLSPAREPFISSRGSDLIVQTIPGLSGRQHHDRPTNGRWKMPQVASDQSSFGGQARNLQEGQIIQVRQHGVRPGPNHYDGVLVFKFCQEGLAALPGYGETGARQHFTGFGLDAVVIRKAQASCQNRLHQPARKSAGNEESRHDDVRIQDPTGWVHLAARARRAFRAAAISRSMSAMLSRSKPRLAAPRRISLTARRARERTSSCTSSSKVSSLVGVSRPLGWPFSVMTTLPSRPACRRAFRGLAASSFVPISFMPYY